MTNLTKCKKWKNCFKVRMVLDKSYDIDEIYHRVMESVCNK